MEEVQRNFDLASSIRHSSDVMDSFRKFLIRTCESCRKALLPNNDLESKSAGVAGIFQLLRQYSRNRKIKTMPLVRNDCGDMPPGKQSSLSISEVIQCYGMATMRSISHQVQFSAQTKQLGAELSGCASTPSKSTLLQAVQACDLSSTLYLLGRERLEMEDKTKALSFATKNGWYMVVDALVDLGAHVNEEDSERRTPLSYASEFGDINTVRTLIKNGAHLSELGDYNERLLPCHYAAKQGHAMIVQDMMAEWWDRWGMDNVDGDEMTLLNWAIKSGNANTVQALLAKRNSISSNHYHTEKPTLHFAIEVGRVDMVDLLLTMDDVDPNYNHSRYINSPPLICAIRRK